MKTILGYSVFGFYLLAIAYAVLPFLLSIEAIYLYPIVSMSFYWWICGAIFDRWFFGYFDRDEFKLVKGIL